MSASPGGAFFGPGADMHHFSDGARGLGLILDVVLDRLLFLAAIGVSLVIGGAILTF